MSARLHYGPWSPLDVLERRLQLRTLAGIAACHVGSGSPFVRLLRAAEHDDCALTQAQDVFEALPSLTRRRMLATHAAVTFPAKGGGLTGMTLSAQVLIKIGKLVRL